MTQEDDSQIDLGDDPDEESTGRYGGPAQWAQWVSDARKRLFEAVGYFALAVLLIAITATQPDGGRLGAWLLFGAFALWSCFAIINRIAKWREAIADQRLWSAELEGQEAYQNELNRREQRSESTGRWWGASSPLSFGWWPEVQSGLA